MKRHAKLGYPDNFRDKDYRIPRTTKEIYGYEPTLWTEDKRTSADTADKIVFWVSLLCGIATACVYFWR